MHAYCAAAPKLSFRFSSSATFLLEILIVILLENYTDRNGKWRFQDCITCPLFRGCPQPGEVLLSDPSLQCKYQPVL